MSVAPEAVPALPRGVRVKECAIRQGWFLLAPERAVKLDQVAAHILDALDGERDFKAVVALLAAKFDAPEAEIAKDAGAFLADMANRRMVELR